MADTPSSPSKYKKKPASFLMGFTAFASKAFSDTESAMSPTSILDTKPFSALKNPFWTEPTTPKSNPTPPKFDGDGVVGLRIVDSFTDDADNDAAKKHENSKFALLKIQIPALNSTFSVDSPKSPMEFGIKTRNSQLGLLISPKSSSGSPNLGTFSSAEMELSEDYTCVISRGGGHVTKMTRIFDDCVLDSCFGEPAVPSSSSPPNQFESFLSFCHTCRKSLGHGDDIFMYRGEKAFCSDECRQREMLMEERLEKQGALGEDDDFGSW